MAQKYNLPMRIIHWTMSIMIIGMIITGWYMQGIDPDAADKYDLYPWHKSFGLTLFFLIILRVLVRFSSKKPKLPAKLAPWEKTLSHIGHFLLYALMIMVPVSGIIFSDAGGHPLNFFFTSFDVLATDKGLSGTAHELHEILPYVLLGVIVLHIAGALKHRFFDKDPEKDVLKRML